MYASDFVQGRFEEVGSPLTWVYLAEKYVTNISKLSEVLWETV